jgi:SAM-dependent methyltransferase
MELEHGGHYQDMARNEETEIVEELEHTPWRDVVRRRYSQSRPWLYSIIMDPERSALLKVLPLKQGGRFLDVGSGWGQVAIPLARHGDVYCLDLTMPRIRILRQIARQEGVALKYVCGNFRSFPFAESQFDAILFNGTLEYMAVGTEGVSIRTVHQNALGKACKLLSDQGVVYVGIENSLGLKYLLGAPDDHTNLSHLTYLTETQAISRFAQSYSGVGLRIKTWSLKEYQELFTNAGLRLDAVFGCFPDYKLIRRMIPLHDVNDILMENGLVYPEHSGVDGSVLPQNDVLPALYRALAANRIAEYFCPSYAFLARRA